MQTAFETLVKILNLERKQDYHNNAVIGGLGAFSLSWHGQARSQARTAEQLVLANELAAVLRDYDAAQTREQRAQAVDYMLQRLLGRKPAPPHYAAQLEAAAVEIALRPPRGDEGERRPRGEQGERPAREGNKRRDAAERREQPTTDAPTTRPQRDERADAPQQAAETGERRSANAERGRGERDAKAERRSEGAQREDRRQQDKAGRGGKARVAGVENNRREGGGKPSRGSGKPSGGAGGQQDDVFSRREDYTSIEYEFRSDDRGHGPLDIPVPARLARPPRTARQAIDPAAAADLLRGLHAPVEVMKGIGPEKARMLNKLGIATVQDMLFFLPRRYDDYTQLRNIRELKPDEQVTVIGTVRHAEVRISSGRRSDFHITVDDGSSWMTVTFFGQSYLARSIRPNQQIVLRGMTSTYRGRIQMTNPEWEAVDLDDLRAAKIVPVYPLTEGLNARQMRRLVERVLDYWTEHIPDYVPESILERTELADLGWALRNLHLPESWDHLEHAKRRYIFDQLLLVQLAILHNRRTWQSVPADPLPVSDEQIEAMLGALFPYPLTGAQRRSIHDIRLDIARDIPMNRLLQGDVGSGKTAVAIMALAMAFLNGKQSAIMAPTGILAEQHDRNIRAALARMPVERQPVIALLTGAVGSAERDRVYAGLADGSIDIVVGTQAIIQEGLTFRDLGLAIIDEQHRFGVEQRGRLRGMGRNPHLLVMTATPIPRTLALTIYADLDLSIIDEMPPGREPVRTRVIAPNQVEAAHNLIIPRLEAGHQAFIVYPLVEASDRIDAQAAVDAFGDMQQVFHRFRVGLLHGRMKPAEKDAVMAAFREREYDVLVTTSVAEVGVDIPNASVILIHSANRFGLAQLHQFRGRVGRGGIPSLCLLVADTHDPMAQKRLQAMELTNDGFQLAEIDWKLRGPGDLVGTQQSGKPIFRLMQDVTPELVQLAQNEARTLFIEDPDLQQPEHRLLGERVAMLRNERTDLS
jgi:ATP-dependent DNA helicase RecG